MAKVALTIIVVVGLLMGTAHAQDEQDQATAKRLVEEGQKFQDAGDYDQAIAKFEEAYALIPHPVLLFNLAQVHRLAGHRAKALDNYEKYVAISSMDELAAKSKIYIEELKADLAANPEPEKPVETPVETPVEKPVEPPPPVVTPAEPSSSGRHMSLTNWIIAGSGIVALGLGSVLSLNGNSDFNSCADQGGCDTQNEADDIKSKMVVGNVLMGVGVAALATSAILYFTSGSESSVAVTASQDGAGVSWVGRF